jgi:hypothetical protein
VYYSTIRSFRARNRVVHEFLLRYWSGTLNLLAGFLGLGRATASAIPTLGLKISVILSAALRSLPPPFRPRLTAAGSFFFAKVAERGYLRIMHEQNAITQGSHAVSHCGQDNSFAFTVHSAAHD